MTDTVQDKNAPTTKQDWIDFVTQKRTTRFKPDSLPIAVSMHNEMGIMVVRVVAVGKRDVTELWGKRVKWDDVSEADAKQLAIKAYEKLMKIANIIRQ